MTRAAIPCLLLCAYSLLPLRGVAQSEQPSGAPTPGEVRDFAGIPFVWCPPGEYFRGIDKLPEEIQKQNKSARAEWYADALPRHRVALTRGFWLSQTEVTRQQWLEVMQTQPWEKEPRPEDLSMPVTQVSWEDARTFAERLSQEGRVVRLPTEAEWEYACRAGSETFYFFGNDHKALDDFAWHWGNSTNRKEPWPHPAGQKNGNPWGLRDMAGNVWEWCEDTYGPYSPADQTDPRAQDGSGLRIVRGGSFTDWAPLLFSSVRAGSLQGTRNAFIGFRVLLEAE